MKTKVINVRGLPRSDLPCIYVGRAMPGLAGHELGNPFRLTRESDRDACLDQYKDWLFGLPDWQEKVDRLAQKVKETGLPLGCWCAPKTCHADLLAALIDLRLSGATDANYEMVVPFWIDTDAYTDRDREMFVCGVEFEMVRSILDRGIYEHQRTIHTENESRLRMLCGRYPVMVAIDASGVEGWSFLTITPR